MTLNTEIILSLESILERNDEGEIQLHSHQKDAIEQVVERFREPSDPLAAWFDIECWLYESDQKEKPIEIKSAIAWGALWVTRKMGRINWDTMRELYGECMSKLMNLR